MKKVFTLLMALLMFAFLSSCTFSQASAPQLNKQAISIEKGKSYKLKLKGADSGKVKWISKNKNIATVKNGKVTARQAGSTKIIAKYKGKKYSCKVKVMDSTITQPQIDEVQTSDLVLTVDGIKLDVEWENNKSVEALKSLAPLTINTQQYGGFEQVGDIGSSLPQDDSNITTQAGDIVLYSSNSISIFYDSNTWSYTRLGKITGKTQAELKELLGKDRVTVSITRAENKEKIMVVYFSQTGRTKKIAEKISEITGGEIQRILPADPYTDEDLDYNDSSTRATVEQNDLSVRPEIKNKISLSGCTTLYLGYPIWWGQAPRIMDTFVEEYDLSGITIIPFCTSGSSSIGGSANRLEELAGAGSWKPGKRFSTGASADDIRIWTESF